MKFSQKVLFFPLLLALLAAASPVSGQETTGGVTGTVVDPGGAVIANATVTLVNQATGATHREQTDGTGGFRFKGIPAGSYTLEITVAGFESYRGTVDVGIDSAVPLGAIPLQISGPGIVIDGDLFPNLLMDSQSAQLMARYGWRVVSEVMWGTMGLDSTAFLTAGIVPGFGNLNTNTQTGGQFPGGHASTAGGLRARATLFSLEGHDLTDIGIGGPAFFLTNLDNVAEYEVVLYPFEASLGRLPGAHINVVTKSGTNQFHGSVFDFYESSGLRARTRFEERFRNDKGKFVQHYYGGTFGGPFMKNKLFGFGSFSRSRAPNSGVTAISGSDLVLTQASATALAAALPNNATRLYRDRGPFSIPDGNPRCTSGPFNATAAGLPVALCPLAREVPADDLFWEYSLRFDLVLAKQSLTGRWLHQSDDFCCGGGADGYWVAAPFNAWLVSLGHTYQFSPTIVNDFRFSASRFFVAFEGGNTLPGVFESLDAIRGNLSRMNMAPGLLDFGLPSSYPQGRLFHSFQWQDSVSLVHGRHTLKAGLEFRRYRTTAAFLPLGNGQYNFPSLDALGFNAPSSVNFADGPLALQPFETNQFYYFQDDFRLRPNLILNLGLRYEHTGQPVNAIHQETLAREAGAGGFWNPAVPLEHRVFPRFRSDSNNWGPRLGFAYSPRFWKRLFGDDRTVIRGGYLVAYEASFYNLFLNAATSSPRVFAVSAALVGVQGNGTGAALAPFLPPLFGIFDPREFPRTTLARDLYSPYAQNWSLGIQRELTSNLVAEARYVATRGVGLFQSVNANPRFLNYYQQARSQIPAGLTPCFPFSGGVPSTFRTFAYLYRPRCDSGLLLERTNGGQSTYHGLQTRVDLRDLFGQATAGVSFTWSKTIDNVSEVFPFLDSGSIAFSENPFRTNSEERGLSNLHLGRVFTAYWIWDSPWLKEQKGWAGKLAGGWQWNGQLFFYDGRPWTPAQLFGQSLFGIPFCAEDTAFNNAYNSGLETCRPYLGNPNAPLNTVGLPGDPNARWWINNGTLGPGQPGVGRNPKLYGDGVALANMGFFKNTRWGDEGRYTLQFRVMTQNVLNHRNFGVPDPFVDAALPCTLLLVPPPIGGCQSDFARPDRNDAVGRLVRLGLRFTF